MSITLNPGAIREAVAPSPIESLTRLLARGTAALRQVRQEHRSRMTFEMLDDHILRDIGFERIFTGQIVRRW